MSKVTIKTIAKCAGVSIGTVDRALNGRGRIKEETKNRVLAVADDLGYEPNKIASALRKKKSLKIAVVLPLLPHYFMDELRNGAELACKELTDYGTEIHFIHSDTLNPLEQEKILDELNYEEYAGIAINAGGEQLKPIINKISRTNIPVVTFNSDVENSERLFYVGENHYQSGRVAGEMMGRMLCGRGRVVVFTGFENVNSHRLRVTGFKDYLNQKCPQIKVVNVVEYHDSDIKAREIVKNICNKENEINGIFCASTPGAIGVGRYFLEERSNNNVCLIGYDISKEIIELMKLGVCTATLYQNPKKQAYEAVKLLSNYLNKQWFPEHKCYFTKTQIVMCENMSDYESSAIERGILGEI